MRHHNEVYSDFGGPRFSLNGSRLALATVGGEWFKKPKDWESNVGVTEEEWLKVYEGGRVKKEEGLVVTDGAYLEEVS